MTHVHFNIIIWEVFIIYEAVGIAKKMGITTGVGNNLFLPGENITRRDMMVLTARALEKFKGLKVIDEAFVMESYIS